MFLPLCLFMSNFIMNDKAVVDYFYEQIKKQKLSIEKLLDEFYY